MLYGMVTTSFQDAKETLYVAIHVFKRVIQRVPNTGLGCEVNDRSWSVLRKDFLQLLPIIQILLVKLKIFLLHQHPKSVLLQGYVVVMV
jgi:hypothetical protein